MARWNRGDPYPEDWPEWLKGADIEWCVVEVTSDGYVIWNNGIWINGTWYGGTWENGSWENGTWRNGTWRNGTWLNGSWWNGVWWAGTWRKGTWESGIWESGHQCRPRFGWFLSSDGLIRGFDSERWESKTAEEWQPLLEGMPRDKVHEFNSLVFWLNKPQQKIKDSPETSIWDHLLTF